MRLTALTLHGFKSFGNRTTLEFAPGITAVVGPNGSGKSNVIDGLKWASGGGRASEFRAGEKTELIFHGAAGKRSLGYAEVEIELRDDRRKVSVFRSLHRDGTGRLRLNGKAARFLDIDEELAGSGLGKSGLAIIGQGEVSGVLMADPAKLLQYVAEVAGVARLAGRREQTEDRLAAARSHLERLEDLIQELQRQTERLELEAAGAARHAELSRESLRLRYTLARLRESILRSEIGALGEDRGALEAELTIGRGRLEEGKEAVLRQRAMQTEAEREYREGMAESEARRGDVRVCEARVESLDSRVRDLERRVSETREELAGLAGLEVPVEPEASDPETLAGAEAEADARRREALGARAAAEEELLEARRTLDRLRGEAAKAAQRSAALESRRTALGAELEELRQQAAELEARAGAGEALAEQEARTASLRERHKAQEAELAGLRESLNDAQARHANALAEAQARVRAAERSRQAFEARRGYAEGPRNALSSKIPGVHGSVADLIRVPESYREALGAALGRRLEYVVVANADTGQRVLDHVRKAGGFVTVLPLDLVSARPPHLSAHLREQPGVVSLAAELVECDPRFAPVMHQLLGNTTVVRSMPEAIALARRERTRPRLVTLDGNLVESYGAMSGGRRQAQAGVLGAAAELEAAEASAEQAKAVAETALAALTELQSNTRTLIESEAASRRELEVAQAELARSREGEAARRELAADLERRRLRVLAELEGLEGATSPDETALPLAAAERSVLDLEVRLASSRDELEERQREVSDRRQARVLATERLQAFELAKSRYLRDLERRDRLTETLTELEGELESVTRQRSAAVAALEEARRKLPTDLDTKADAHRQAVTALAEVEAQLAQLGEAQAKRTEALERINLTVARREAAWELAAEELRGFPSGVATIEGSERTLKARLAEAAAELEELGAVNHRAGLELEQERQRLAELQLESTKAAEAIGELASTLEQLDLETTTRLEAGVEGLRDGFKRHVVELFGATADADIEVEREGGRPVGMRIRLQPPGKQTRQLNLLSVGERTMGAMAFLFALMSGGGRQGLPIAVLDEVDAPLDEANIRRYCDFLVRLAQRGTQFILVTHQKATFEVADVMWGVTTEQGVSRVFSIARPDAVAVG